MTLEEISNLKWYTKSISDDTQKTNINIRKFFDGKIVDLLTERKRSTPKYFLNYKKSITAYIATYMTIRGRITLFPTRQDATLKTPQNELTLPRT